MKEFEEHFRKAKEAGLGVTLHIAEVRVVPRFPLQSLKTSYVDHQEYTRRYIAAARLQTRQAWARDVLGRGCQRHCVLQQCLRGDLLILQSLVQDRPQSRRTPHPALP